MPYVIGVVAAVLLAILVFSGRRKRPTLSVHTSTQCGYAIAPAPKMLEAEYQDNEEVMRLLEAAIRASGFFRIEAIPELLSKLRGGSEPFARVNTKIAFEDDEFLSVEEKRVLGLNTRMKYSKAFIGYFDPECLKTIEPKSVLENMHLSAFHRVARKRDLLEFRELGFVKQVRIVPVGDARDCGKIKRFRKIHDINQVPELPLPGCTAPYCRCMYEPIISK
jgi:hypothetical protein